MRIPGITSPARSKTSAGPKRITNAKGRAYLPFARPAIAKRTASTRKNAPIAVKTEVNLGMLVERNSDIFYFTFLFSY